MFVGDCAHAGAASSDVPLAKPQKENLELDLLGMQPAICRLGKRDKTV
jgi:hypothetical protein